MNWRNTWVWLRIFIQERGADYRHLLGLARPVAFWQTARQWTGLPWITIINLIRLDWYDTCEKVHPPTSPPSLPSTNWVVATAAVPPHIASGRAPFESAWRPCGGGPASRLNLLDLQVKRQLTVSRTVPRRTERGSQGGTLSCAAGSEPARDQLRCGVWVATSHVCCAIQEGEHVVKEVDRRGVWVSWVWSWKPRFTKNLSTWTESSWTRRMIRRLRSSDSQSTVATTARSARSSLSGFSKASIFPRRRVCRAAGSCSDLFSTRTRWIALWPVAPFLPFSLRKFYKSHQKEKCSNQFHLDIPLSCSLWLL